MMRSWMTQDGWLRLVTALLAAVCLLVSPLEALAVPDVHDGDLAAIGHAATERQAGVAGSGPVQQQSESVPQPGSQSRDTLPSGHTTHVDHCVHGHLPGLMDVRLSPLPPNHLTSVIGDPAQLHESVVLSPLQRPPIA